MLEQSLRELFKRMADVESPPGRVTVADLLRQGRIRRRRQRIGRAGTPVLAAVAVAAIAVAGTLPSGSPAKPTPQAGGYGKLVDGAFNPSYLAIKFGKLPKGYVVGGGETSPAVESLSSYNSKLRLDWQVSAYARDVCRATTDAQQFQCSQLVASQPTVAVTGPGPVIDGRTSLWLKSGQYPGRSLNLAFEYAPNAWAVVSQTYDLTNKATAVWIARATEFGQHIPISFAARFTSLPVGWRILGTYFSAGRDGVGSPPAGVYLAWSYKILRLRTISPATPVIMGTDTVPGVPLLGIFPALSGSNGCQDTRSKHVTIHGYRFIVSDQKSSAHRDDYSVRCPDVDGLTISVNEIGAAAHPNWVLSPAQVLERTQLLGPDPADWVTNPLP